ncbi:molecular chaperone Tir [Burkholderia cepacia JBK9]|uniref:CesT family type III secretion system chaperone n=1 Tax=Burkholderia arboris TaxID=488730 RepID=A0A9Q9SGY6_9BURK|nr:CesT family type III secretion system chaperone [Burkholderia arboris]ALX16811.1 molecular chaperone Tir [Burkholderia cepacia JBK9]MCA8489326.1 CesT family type III secretion system chaperone [Burkholderia arboris]UTV60697.1 CesT family type III secretion system chaperone [Burkholderia arboris]VWB50394.1 HpaB [Burkholderia arboris]
MSIDIYTALVGELCAAVGLPDVDHILQTRTIEVEGFDVRLDYFDNDPGALYVNFHYGTVTAGRTLTIFRLMLEANLLIYAQDQAQLGMDSDTGGIVLIVRVPFADDVTGETLADLLSHYAEHGRYWRQNIIESNDDMFEGIATGEFIWLRA